MTESCGLLTPDHDPGPIANQLPLHIPGWQDASTVVNVTANDGEAEDDDPHTVEILNVAPVISGPNGDASVNEGDGTHTYTFSFTDPGADTWTPSASCGTNGTLSELALDADSLDDCYQTGLFKRAWSDHPARDQQRHRAASPSATAIGGSDTENKTVTVNNVAPCHS